MDVIFVEVLQGLAMNGEHMYKWCWSTTTYGKLVVFSFAHLGDGKTLGLLTNVTDHYHFRQITPALNYTGPILHRPYITPALYYTGPILHRPILHQPFNLTTNYGQNYRYFRPCY